MNPLPLLISVEQGLLVLATLLSIVLTIRLYSPNRPLTLILRGWLVLTALAAGSGYLSDFTSMPPNFFYFMVPQTLAVIYFTLFSKSGLSLLRVPQWLLVGLQTFRIFVELILAQLANHGLLPYQLTYRGLNFDIVTGFLGLALGYMIYKEGEEKWRTAILSFNLLGLALLFNIVVHGAGSIPTPFQLFHYEINNWVMAVFPMHWLPLFLVPVAMALHFLSLRKLKAKL